MKRKEKIYIYIYNYIYIYIYNYVIRPSGPMAVHTAIEDIAVTAVINYLFYINTQMHQQQLWVELPTFKLKCTIT